MKTDRLTYLEPNEISALDELTQALADSWPGIQSILFGSKVSGNADSESDLDVLILFPGALEQAIRQKIVHLIFELNLRFNTNISPVVLSLDEWMESPLTILPFHATIEREGVPL
ncbi:nucleotidyltransferase domain-containing protein [bacterium]|nr:nucleotidyltransferase domain-containing protein [bacterium]